MCEICLKTPCDSRCPNADEPKEVYKCEHCGLEIVEGDDFFELDGCYYHEDCFEEIAVDLLLKKGATKGVAEVGGWLW